MISRIITIALVGMSASAFAQRNDPNARARQQAERFFQQHDKNDDGKLSRDEFPQNVKQLFGRIDTNRDGFVDLNEDIKFRAGRNRPGQNRSQLAKGFVTAKDIEYAEVGGKSLLLDIYFPKQSKEALPLIVWIHGGAWRAGSKDRCPALRFLEKGFVVASINYRLTHEAIFPAQIQDCKAAIRWLRANAKKYRVDPKRVGVWGSSAGGHLVALLGTSGDVNELEGTGGNLDQSSRVQAVVDFFGPTDLLQMDAHALPSAPFKHDDPDSPESKLIGGPIQENKDKAARANPIKYISSDDPPILIVHGDSDPLVPHHQSQIFYEALKKAKVDVRFHTVKGAGHGFGRNEDVERMVDKFFSEKLR